MTRPTFSEKGRIMAMIAQGHGREFFTHQEYGTFDITKTRELLRLGKLPHVKRITDITNEIVSFVMTTREIDFKRVNEIIAGPATQMAEPGIMLKLSDGTDLFIDGHHRLLARAALGVKDFRFYQVAFADAIYGEIDPTIEREIEWGQFRATKDGFQARPKDGVA